MNSKAENLEDYLKSSLAPEINLERILKTSKSELHVFLDASMGENEVKSAVNFMLDHYGLIFIGVLSGYFPYDFNKNLTFEIIRFLEIEAVREYYTFTKRQFLPQAIRAYCSAIEYRQTYSFEDKYESRSDLFNEFLVLNRTLAYDSNIQLFLSEIRGGKTDYTEIIHIINTREGISNAFQHCDEEALVDRRNIIVGAIQFAYFICELKLLLDKALSAPILQSTLWSFYGFYFETAQQRLIMFYERVFEKLLSIYQALDDSDFKLHNEELKPDFINENEAINRLNVIFVIDESRKSVFQILDSKYSKALKKAVRNQLTDSPINS